MRWIIGLFIAFIIFIAVYLGSAALALSHLVSAVRAGDGAAVLAQTDTRALSHSLTNQIVSAYLDEIGAKRTINPQERFLANTYGATIADAMVTKMLTAEKLTELLKAGSFSGADKVPAFTGMSALGHLKPDDILGLIGRLSIVQPVLLSVRVSDATSPDDASYAAIALRHEGLTWKLAGINLPRKVLHELAASLRVK